MISTWVWTRLPGNAWAKAGLLVAAAAVLVVVLFEWVFPAIAPLLPIQEQTVEAS